MKKVDSDIVLKPPPKGYDNPFSDLDLKPQAKPNWSMNSQEPTTLPNQQSQAPKTSSPHKPILHRKSI